MSIVSLWLYCHRFGVNSHSVAVIATGYPVAIATAYYKTLIGVTSSKHSLCTFTMYQLQHSFTVAVIEHGHCSYDQFHKLYYLLLQCLPFTNAMQCCSFLCLYYNIFTHLSPGDKIILELVKVFTAFVGVIQRISNSIIYSSLCIVRNCTADTPITSSSLFVRRAQRATRIAMRE